METMYFVLGMLSIVGAAFVATTVWGVVKINKLIKSKKQLETWIIDNDRIMRERDNDLHKDLYSRSEELDRRISTLAEELSRDINDKTDKVTSYVDSRIDKAFTFLTAAKQVTKD